VANDLLVQVTSSAVRLIDAQSGALRGSWSPASGRITTAAANVNHVLCAIGTQLVLLAPSSNGFTEVSSARMPHEVACLSIGQTEDKLACNWAAVGLWEDCSVHILRLPDLATVGRENTLASASDAVILPRSLLLCTLGNSGDTASTSFSSAAMLLSSVQPQLYLFCGLGDGTLIAFKLDHNSVAYVHVSSLKPFHLLLRHLPHFFWFLATVSLTRSVFQSVHNPSHCHMCIVAAATAMRSDMFLPRAIGRR
jgi:hypothetical protein